VAEPVTSPRDLLAARLRQALWIELQLAERVLPKLLDGCFSSDLEWSFERHLVETEGHVETVRSLLSQLRVHAEPEQSPALLGLLAEHEELTKRIGHERRVLLDLAHAEAAAAAEHLEISLYGGLVRLAEALGEDEIGIALRDVEEQERHALELVGRGTTRLLAERVEAERGQARP
jgi:ferritin-like metal-binding protein YciE